MDICIIAIIICHRLMTLFFEHPNEQFFDSCFENTTDALLNAC